VDEEAWHDIEDNPESQIRSFRNEAPPFEDSATWRLSVSCKFRGWVPQTVLEQFLADGTLPPPPRICDELAIHVAELENDSNHRRQAINDEIDRVGLTESEWLEAVLNRQCVGSLEHRAYLVSMSKRDLFGWQEILSIASGGAPSILG